MENERLKKNDEPRKWSGNGILLFFAFYLAILVLAAVLSPILFFTTKYLGTTFSLEIFQHFIGKGFEKFFDRAKLVSAIILLFPFVKIAGIKSAGDIWIGKFPRKRFFLAFACGTVLVCLIYVWLLWTSPFALVSPEPLPAEIYLFNFVKFGAAAAGIGFLEELLFRGVIFRFFSENVGRILAVILGALFFAYCHAATARNLKIDGSDVTIFSGFRCIIPSLLSICHNFNLLNFLNLILFGIFLTILLLKFESIFMPIAFHIGVVFALMNARSCIKITAIFGGSRGILDTWLTAGLLGMFIVCLFPGKADDSSI
ncbi:MAG: CPBP family intramembrane metalloprotease [Puniceicoccales bacterium]|jgi:membrane protease YdiL (CAAX protease family)|nr:CPBP family intramembrane metalloprotease [Puniceicoccales bacterium]